MRRIIKKNIYKFLSFFSCSTVNIEKIKSNLELLYSNHTHISKDINLKKQREIGLSLIIPVYNSGILLERSLKSIFLQDSLLPYEIIIVFDSTSDKNTHDVLNSIQTKTNQKLTIIRTDHVGAGKARNIGLENSIYEYIMFVDADDLLPNGTFDIYNKAIFSDSCQSDIIQGNYVSFDNNNNKKEYRPSDNITGYPWGKIFKYSLFSKYGFLENCFFEDTSLFFLVYPFSGKNIFVNNFVYSYYLNEKGLTLNQTKNINSIDTIWVSLLCIDEAIKIWKSSYDISCKIIQQLMINDGRLMALSSKIRKWAFLLLCDYFESKGLEIPFNQYPNISKSIKNKNYFLFKYYMEINTL